MKKFPHAGERGVSILGALVVALMLGAGAIATFEMASPPLSSVSSGSQTAQTIAPVKVVKPATTASTDDAKKLAASGTLKNQQTKACQEAIKKSATAGEPVNIDKVTITRERGKQGLSSDEIGIAKVQGSDKEEVIMDLCISVQKSKSYSEATRNKTSSYECKGRTAIVKVDQRGVVTSESRPEPKAAQGECRTLTCKPAKISGKLECVATRKSGYDPGEALRAFPSGAPKITLDEKELNEKGIGTTNLARETDAMQEALNRAQSDKEMKGEIVKSTKENLEKAISNLAECAKKSCSDKDNLESVKKAAEEAYKKAANEYRLSQEQLDNLSANRATLAGGAMDGPPDKGDGADKDDTVTCKGGVCKNSKGETVPAPGRDTGTGNEKNNTFGQPGGMNPGLAQLLGQTLSQLLGGGKQCAKTQQEYQQQQQQYQQELQQYNYQQQQWLYMQQLGSQYSSSPPRPPTPLPSPCIGQGGQNSCPSAPAQPDPSGCASGSWRPTYSGACVAGWQCVPTGGSAITAQLACQPQVADVGATIAISYSCSSGTSEGSGFETSGAQSGTTTATIANPPAGTNIAIYGLKCTDGAAVATKQCSVQVARPAIVLVANPKIVVAGKTSAIGWVTSGMSSCVISSPNLQSFTDEHKNTTNVNGSVVTPALSSTSDFVLKCTTIGGSSKSATTTVTVQ